MRTGPGQQAGERPRTHGERVRADLVASAVRAVEREGLQAFTLRRFAAEVGTTSRMLVHHFGSRDGLLAHVLREMVRSDAALPAAMADDIAGLAAAAWDLYQAPGMQLRLAIYFHLAGRAISAPGEVVSDAYDRTEWLVMWVDMLQRSGVQAEGARESARLIHALGSGVMTHLVTGQMTPEEARHHYITGVKAIARLAAEGWPTSSDAG